MIIAVYNTNQIIYTSDSDISSYSSKYTVIPNCTLEQTSYGSVIIKRPTYHQTLELYPHSISHIISN